MFYNMLDFHLFSMGQKLSLSVPTLPITFAQLFKSWLPEASIFGMLF